MQQTMLDKFIAEAIEKRLVYNKTKDIDGDLQKIVKICKISQQEAKERLKSGIFEFVGNDLKVKGYDFLGQAKSIYNIYNMSDIHIASDFFKEEWRKIPFTMIQEDFDKVQAIIKKPLKYKFYDYNKAIYNFLNEKELHSNFTEKIFNDKKIIRNTQFYLSEERDEQNLFAKQTEFTFKAKSLKKVKEALKDKSEIELFKDEDLFARTLSISMYVLLDGDPKKAFSIMRYDNQYDSSGVHKNIYVGRDNRAKVFGYNATYPHFHFQNENDALICLKKNKFSDSYKTSRCNSIDCVHLKKYLLDLDSKSGLNLKKERENNGSYGMPFLAMKEEKYKFNIDVVKLVDDYFKQSEFTSGKDNTVGEEQENKVVEKINDWLIASLQKEDYRDSDFKCFANLIKAVDFVKFLNNIRGGMNKILTAQDRLALSEIETLVASEIVDEVNKISTRFVTKEVDGNEEEIYID